ncbi:hypothetical protein Nepgr_033095 [Nepenthes gracilis]|uniref:Uncharacterized protein n=1 Tax=Nepenthes gracilis TaxID=150966 RepID=A0AAD3TKS0_NEPGR|nr:hypothetical protein Nepgr_033095 [Nepenthes gracilis]
MAMLHPNALRYLVSLCIFAILHGNSFDAKAARIIFRFTELEDWVSMSSKAGFHFRGTNPDSVKGWKERFFFLQEPPDFELPRAWRPISEYFQEKPTPEDVAESEKLISAIKSEEAKFSIQGKEGPGDTAAPPPSGGTEEESCSLLESSSGDDEDEAALKRLREAEWTSLRRSRRRIAGPSIVAGSPATKRSASAGRQGETTESSSTLVAGLAAREVCEVESLPTGNPPACSTAEATDDVVVLEGPKGLLPEGLATSTEDGVALAADPIQADEGEAGTSSWQEPQSVPMAASLPVSTPPAGEGAGAQGEALPGDLAGSPSATPAQAPGGAHPFEVIAALRGDLQQAILNGRAQFASLEKENGRLQ